MGSTIHISVVIPARNRANTIELCLLSVLDQTRPPDEVIVVDDCSTDGTASVVEARGDKRVKIVRLSQRCGAQAARNRGIAEAEGDWIAFQDSDDEWLPRRLEKEVDALSGYDFDPFSVVHSDCMLHKTNGGGRRIWKLPHVQGEKEKVFQRLLTEPGPMFQAMLVSQRALSAIGFLDPNVPAYQEWDTSIRLAECCRFIHLHEPLFVYHLGQGISSSADRGVEGYRYVIEKHKAAIRRVCGEEAWRKHLRTLLGLSLRANLLEKFYDYRKAYSVTDDEIGKVVIQEMCHALNEGQWEKVRSLCQVSSNRNVKVRAMDACRCLHLRPRYLSGLKNLIGM